MKTKLFMLFAVICLAFAASEAKAQQCNFPLENATRCAFRFEVFWDCGGTLYTTSGTVNAQSSISSTAPFTNPCTCTFLRVALQDCNGNWISFDPSFNPSGTICDCNNNTANVSINTNSGGYYVYIYP
jgi:hypothetical protein